MMDRDSFDRQLAIIDRLVDRAAVLPAQVFRAPMASFHVIEFDVLLARHVFARLQRLAAAAGSEAFNLGVLEPDPQSYFHAHFGKYPFLRFTATDSADRFIEALNEDPGDSPADAIATNSDVVVVYPDSAQWLIYGDRRLEIAIVAAADAAAAAAIEADPPARLFHAADAVTLLEPLFRGSVPPDIASALIQNYGSPLPSLRGA